MLETASIRLSLQVASQLRFRREFLVRVVVEIDVTGQEVFGRDSRESQQLTYLELGQLPRPVAFNRQCLEALAARVCVPHHPPPYASKSPFTAFSIARAASSSHPRGRFFKSARKVIARMVHTGVHPVGTFYGTFFV